MKDSQHSDNYQRAWHRTVLVRIIVVATACLLTLGSTARSQGVWKTDTSRGFYDRNYHSSSTVGDSIFSTGGQSETGAFIQIFNPAGHTWTTPKFKGDSDFIEGHSSCAIGDSIYIVGGLTNLSDSLINLRIYDVMHDTWDTPSVSGHFTPCSELTSSVVNGKIYAVGGVATFSLEEDSLLNTLEVFDPSSNSWSTPNISGKFTPREGLTSSVVNGKVYVIGGDTAIGSPCNILEVFDPSTSSWSTPSTSGTFTARGFLTSCVFNDKIYVIGGDTAGMIRPCALLEIFDPSTNTWSEGPSMPTSRFGLSSSVVNGKIYVLGGYAPHGALNTVEVFTPGPLGVNDKSLLTNTFSLENYPDPITSRTLISFTLFEASALQLTLTDAVGRETPLLHSAWVAAGPHEVTWDASKYPSGVYLCRLASGGDVVTKKLIVQH